MGAHHPWAKARVRARLSPLAGLRPNLFGHLPCRIPQFELNENLTKKEQRKIKKNESMIQYHLARVPFYNGRGSEHWLAAEDLKEQIANYETNAKKRWEAGL